MVSDPIQAGDIAVVGVPFDRNSSYLRGTAKAPPLVREAMHSYSTNLFTEDGIDLSSAPGWRDVGDLQLPDEATAYAGIEPAIAALLEAGVPLDVLRSFEDGGVSALLGCAAHPSVAFAATDAGSACT